VCDCHRRLEGDGKRIAALMLQTRETQQRQNHVIFLLDFDELRRKVPAGK
jgi:hypothetical protein